MAELPDWLRSHGAALIDGRLSRCDGCSTTLERRDTGDLFKKDTRAGVPPFQNYRRIRHVTELLPFKAINRSSRINVRVSVTDGSRHMAAFSRVLYPAELHTPRFLYLCPRSTTPTCCKYRATKLYISSGALPPPHP